MHLFADEGPGASIGPYVIIKVNGVDITNRCAEVNDIEGYAVCLRLNEAGHPYTEDKGSGIPAKEILQGDIQIELKPNAPAHIREIFNKLGA